MASIAPAYYSQFQFWRFRYYAERICNFYTLLYAVFLIRMFYISASDKIISVKIQISIRMNIRLGFTSSVFQAAIIQDNTSANRSIRNNLQHNL